MPGGRDSISGGSMANAPSSTSSGGFTRPTVISTDPRSAEQRDFQNMLMTLMRANLQSRRMPTFGQMMPNLFQQLYGPSAMGMSGGGRMPMPGPGAYPGSTGSAPMPPPRGSGLPVPPSPPPQAGTPWQIPWGPPRQGGDLVLNGPGGNPSMFMPSIASGSRMIRSGVGANYPTFGSMRW